MVHQPKSANIHVVAERCTGSAFVSLTSLALYLMTTNMAATSDYKTERGPSVTPNGVDNTDCDDSDNMESCLESRGSPSHRGKGRPDGFSPWGLYMM